MVDYLGGVIMKCYRILMVLLLLGFSTATVSMASPLTLDYRVIILDVPKPFDIMAIREEIEP
jgi:hypothetical protein